MVASQNHMVFTCKKRRCFEKCAVITRFARVLSATNVVLLEMLRNRAICWYMYDVFVIIIIIATIVLSLNIKT